jgi:DNA-binding NarL/FixJ family response regulator
MLIWKTRATRSVRKRPAHPIWVFGSSDAFAGQIPAKVDPELDQLTMREREMLRLIVRGYKEIALQLNISAKSVEVHV